MKLKPIILGILSAAILTCNAFAVNLFVDHERLACEVPPTIVSGRTLVPMRALFEALGAKIDWDPSAQTVTATQNNVVVSIQIGNKTAQVNGVSRPLDVPAQLLTNRTMVPLRFVSEALQAEVHWDEKTQTISVISPAAQGKLAIYYLDVGQADSILLLAGNEAMMIDAGKNATGKEVVSFLQEKGVTRLKYAVGTHPHEDHIGGLDNVLNTYPTDEVLMPNVITTTKTFSDVLAAIETHDLKLTVPNSGDTYKLGDANIAVMNTLKTKDLNDASLVLKVTHGNHSFLFTGDAEAASEASMLSSGASLRSSVLKVGHHGSKTSTTAAFLNAVQPTDAIISCGANNQYGHPHAAIISRLKGIRVWRTDQNGTITLISDGASYEITAQKN